VRVARRNALKLLGKHPALRFRVLPVADVAHCWTHPSRFMPMTRRRLSRPGVAAVLLAAASVLGCDDDDALSCDGLGDEAMVRRSEIEQAGENRECSADADCVAAYHPLRCAVDCGEPAAVSRSMEGRVAADVAAVEAELCGQHEQQGCPAPLLVPCVPTVGASPAVCRNAKCEIQPLLLE
jgi:hypothetical protein